jgi:hypothetical protein
VVASELWRHADDEPTREGAVKRLTEMLKTMIRRATKDKLHLAPFIGIGCPGLIRNDRIIEKGGQNLPGNWEHKQFNLPHQLRDALPTIDGHAPSVLIHNDAVAQGLSEAPFMRDVEHWGVIHWNRTRKCAVHEPQVTSETVHSVICSPWTCAFARKLRVPLIKV